MISRYITIACDGWELPSEALDARSAPCERNLDGDGFRTESEAVTCARENGWLVRRDGSAFCPICRKVIPRRRAPRSSGRVRGL